MCCDVTQMYVHYWAKVPKNMQTGRKKLHLFLYLSVFPFIICLYLWAYNKLKNYPYGRKEKKVKEKKK